MIEIDDKTFIAAINHIAASEEGQIVLAILKDSCGWDKTYLASDNPQSSHYYAVKRGVYGGLRQHIKPEYLKKIEFDYTRKVVEHDTKRSPTGAASITSSSTSRRSDRK